MESSLVGMLMRWASGRTRCSIGLARAGTCVYPRGVFAVAGRPNRHGGNCRRPSLVSCIGRCFSSPLEELGLGPALEQLGSNTAQRFGITVDVSVGASVGDLEPELANAIYRIADETLANVARHSGAEAATVDLVRRGGRVRLEVADDGSGFDAQAEPPAGHFGIKGITERAAMVGGALVVASNPGVGTSVVFEVKPWT